MTATIDEGEPKRRIRKKRRPAKRYPKSNGPAGIAYLLHFDRPYHHAAHYIGWTSGDLDARIAAHHAADIEASPLMAAVVAAGIDFELARVWRRITTRRCKRLRTSQKPSQICPVCRPELKRLKTAKKAAASSSRKGKR